MKNQALIKCFSWLIALMLLALPAWANIITQQQTSFDYDAANKQFDELNIKLSTQNLNVMVLSKAVNALEHLNELANDCVEETQKKLIGIEKRIKAGTVEGVQAGPDVEYLNQQKEKVVIEQSKCRHFAYRSQEALAAYKKTLASLTQEKTFKRGLPIWKLYMEYAESDESLAYREIDRTGLENLGYTDYLLFLFASLVVAAIAYYFINKFYSHSIKSRIFVHFARCKKILIFFISFFGLWLIYFTTQHETELEYLSSQVLCEILLIYFLGLFLIDVIFSLRRLQLVIKLYGFRINFLKSLSIVVFTLYCINLVFHSLFDLSKFNSLQTQFYESCIMLILLTTIYVLVSIFIKTHQNFKIIRINTPRARIFTLFLCLTLFVIDLIGYHHFAIYVLIAFVKTLGLLFVTAILLITINTAYSLLNGRHKINAIMRSVFGYEDDQPLTEFLIFKYVLTFIISVYSILYFMKFWGVNSLVIDEIYNSLFTEINLAGIPFHPTLILNGIIAYALVSLIFKAITTMIRRRQKPEQEEEAQNAIASILSYIGFVIAVLAGLLTAGFNFTGLAIIAGALSVGIGLGLQDIVNNFVSGLILLIEKPIESGDRIVIDGVEGYVKKVRVRSTRILTPQNEDIIIPNSHLVTHRVTNYMYFNNTWRVTCEVGVAYGSDTDLVTKLLLQVANEHPEVIKTGRKKPRVLFRAFGDSALVFHLWAVIRDVRKKNTVPSELNYAIDKIFREHDVCIAFPQMDVHLNYLPKADDKPPKE